MANGLTGDFDAVLEVSQSTVQRLLASLHRNDRDDSAVPTLPHQVNVRLDEATFHGRVTAQVGVPIVSLVPGSTDTFHLEIGIRARYAADPGSEPLADFINGTVDADYRMEPVDASCTGWHAAAADHVWLRVVQGSVRWRGTAVDAIDPYSTAHVIDPEILDARITRLIEAMLTSTFEATPHRVSSGFRPGHLVQLAGERPAVAIPVGLDGSVPPGNPRSVTEAFLEDWADIGLAIDKDVILGGIQAALDRFREGFGTTIRLLFKTEVLGWDIIDVDISWAVRVRQATATWIGPPGLSGSGFDIDVYVAGGGSTQKHEYDWTFDVRQRIHLTVHPGSGWLTVTTVGEPVVQLHYDGPYAADAKAAAAPKVTEMIKGQIQGVANSAGGDLGLLAQSDKISRQLQTLDRGGHCSFFSVRYRPDALVVLGSIALRPSNKGPLLKYAKDEEGRGYGAFRSWMPAGRIDRFAWEWSWSDGSRPPGSETWDDRWVIQRFLPTDSEHVSKYGVIRDTGDLLVGYDGPGQVRLTISGVYVDDETGDLLPFSENGRPIDVHINIGDYQTHVSTSTITGHGGGIDIGAALDPGGLHSGYGSGGGFGGGGFGGGGFTTTGGSNLLVVRPGTGVATEELATQLATGLETATVATGLQVVVLHPEGRLDAAGIAADAQLFHTEVGRLAATFVSEDVDGTWAEALGLGAADATFGADAADPTVMALVTPQGGVSWIHEGELEAPELAGVLDGLLVPAPSPTYPVLPSGFGEGDRLGPWMLFAGSGCPPPPIGRLGMRSMITFLRPSGRANGRTLATLKDLAPDPDAVFTAVVVNAPVFDGAPFREAGLAANAVPITDPDGVIAARFGIRAWPTTLLVDEEGVITKVFTGADVPTPGTRGRPSEKKEAGA